MNGLAPSLSARPVGLAPDPALPQRDLLLDEEQMAGRLSLLISSDGPTAIDSCEKQRIKYRIGESLRVLYRLRVNGRPQMIAAKAFAGLNSRAGDHVKKVPPETSRPFFDAEIGTTFWLYPNDRKIKNLSLLSESPAALTSALGSRWTGSEIVAYVPEKCATARCQDANGQTIGYAKMYAGDKGQSVYRTYRQLASANPCVAKTLTYSERHDLLVLEAVSGARIADLNGDNLRDGLAGLAQTLASLHSAVIPNHLWRFHRHDAERLRNCARIVGLARPDVAALVGRLAGELSSTAHSTAHSVCLHGDVHPKNGIAVKGAVTLIDLDQSAFGPAAADLGSMLALLHYNWRVGLITRTTQAELARAFLDGYGGYRQLPPAQSLRWHTAAALLSERGLRSVNRIRPEGLLHLSQLLTDAREILRTGEVQ